MTQRDAVDPPVHNRCTSDGCDKLLGCVYTPIPHCRAAAPCPGGCDDGNECTEDACVNGECVHYVMEGCDGEIYAVDVACSSDWDCDDAEDCTTDICDAGTCRNVLRDDCYMGECDGDDACDDHDACTTDKCEAGICNHYRRQCPSEDP